MKKVLIVDDSKFIYEEIKLLLNETEYKVAGYADRGEAALAEYERVQPDIVTMDIILPGMDGVEATRQILDSWPDARILMVSSLAYDDTENEAKEAGAKGFIYKPMEKEPFIAMLDKICDMA